MAPRYERIRPEDDDEVDNREDSRSSNPQTGSSQPLIPNSPPPSFHSLESPTESSALADSFDPPSDDEDDGDIRTVQRGSSGSSKPPVETVRLVPAGATRATDAAAAPVQKSNRRMGWGNDGVFANLSAKPQVAAEKEEEEMPPTYEQAAADATPPYWETTILAPGMSSDEVFIDGLPVGSLFAFVWNAMISMSFQLVGFLLTYLLHTTHAAKNGSKAGLGVTLIQYGFYMRASPPSAPVGGAPPADAAPKDPNSINVSGGESDAHSSSGIGRTEWISYILMIVGWFILIRACSEFIRARRTEQVILASPERAAAVVVEGESSERAV